MALVLVLVASSVLGVAASPRPWPEEKYSVSRTGFYPGNWSWDGRRVVDYNVSVILRAGLCIAASPVILDLNGDNVSDIVVNSCDGFTYAISGGNYRVLWKKRTGLGLVSPAAADLDGDKVPDIVIAGPGVLFSLRGSDGAQEWVVKGLFYKTTPGIADVNCDGRPDVVANTLDGKVAVISGSGGIEAWVKVGSQEVSIPAIGDVNGDKCPDIVVAEGNHIHVVSYSNGSWKVYSLGLDARITGYPSLYDVNGDGVLDVIIATPNYLYAIDVKDHELLWRARVTGFSYSSPSVGDVDGDDVPDVVLATTDGIYLFSLHGRLERFFRGVNAAFGSVIISDVDGDGHNELVVARYDGEIDIVDLTGSKNYYDGLEFAYVTQGPIMKPAAIGDVDGDGVPEIIVGSRDFNLYLIDPVTTQPTTTKTKVSPSEASTATPSTTTTTVKALTRTTYASKASITTKITKHPIRAANTTSSQTNQAQGTPVSFTPGASSGLPSPNYGLLAGLAVFLGVVSAFTLLYVKKRR